MPENPKPAPARTPDPAGLQSVLEIVARRLTSQPMLFGLGVLLLLVMVAGFVDDRLSAVTVPALVIFVVASAVWLAAEVLRARSRERQSASAAGVEVTARRIGATGSVSAVEGLPASHSLKGPVNVTAEDVEGKVTGARYANPQDRSDG